MAYQRKTKDVWVIESNYGYGWEEESSYDDYDAAKEDLKEYRIAVSHHFGVCRLKKKRERIGA